MHDDVAPTPGLTMSVLQIVTGFHIDDVHPENCSSFTFQKYLIVLSGMSSFRNSEFEAKVEVYEILTDTSVETR